MNNLVKIAIGGFVAGTLAIGGIVTEPKTLPNNIIESEIVGDVVVYKYRSDVEVLPEKDEDLTKRTENSRTFQIDRDTLITKIYSGTTFNKDVKTGKWYEVETATTTTEIFLEETTPILGIVKRVYADTVFSGAGDGQVEKSNDSDWTNTHDAVTGESASPVASTAEVRTGKTIGGIYSIYRTFLPFNTSSIPANALVTSASLNVYVTATSSGLTDNDGDDYINVVQTSQPNSTTFTTADYDLVGAVSNPPTGATAIDLTAGFTVGAYNTFNLNTTGISWVKIDGQNSSCGTSKATTCLGLREGHDMVNSAFTGVGANTITISTSEAAGTSQDPYLEVTYIIPIATVDLKANTILQGNMLIN